MAYLGFDKGSQEPSSLKAGFFRARQVWEGSYKEWRFDCHYLLLGGTRPHIHRSQNRTL